MKNYYWDKNELLQKKGSGPSKKIIKSIFLIKKKISQVQWTFFYLHGGGVVIITIFSLPASAGIIY